MALIKLLLSLSVLSFLALPMLLGILLILLLDRSRTLRLRMWKSVSGIDLILLLSAMNPCTLDRLPTVSGRD